MTLLHQAAQKAVEALTDARNAYEAWGVGTTKLDRAIAALQQQPEPADSLLASHLAYTRAHLPALQHQEVPREPVADFDTWQQNPYTKVLMDSIKNDYMPRADAEALIRAAASPSTTRQQEVGSRKQLTEEQIILATEHISMERPGVFVYVARAIERAHGIGVAAAPSTPENAGGVGGNDGR